MGGLRGRSGVCWDGFVEFVAWLPVFSVFLPISSLC